MEKLVKDLDVVINNLEPTSELFKSMKQIRSILLKKEPRKICYWTAEDVEYQMRQMNNQVKFSDDDKGAILDIVNDVEQQRCLNNQIELSDADKDAILDIVEANFDANYGVTWESIEYAIIDYLNE